MTYLEVFVDQYRDVYRDLLEVIDSLPEEALNWAPYPEGNSIAVLATHLLGNQLETLRAVKGQPTSRNRSAEFEIDAASVAELRGLVAEAEAVMTELTPQITPRELDAMVRRPARADTAHPGLYQLNHSITHAREHLGQIWMTRDLWKARSSR